MFGKNLKQDIFVSSGFKNWKKALNAFHKHEGTQSHKDSIVSWNSYKASALRGNVVQQIEAASADEIRQRREYMRRIVAVTCMLGKQGLPFRGHDEIRSGRLVRRLENQTMPPFFSHRIINNGSFKNPRWRGK